MKSSQRILNHLNLYGPNTNKQIAIDLSMTRSTVNNAVLRLRNAGVIGKHKGKWAVGHKNDTTAVSLKVKVLELLQEGGHTADEMAEKLDLPRQTVTCEISRLKREMGLNIKRVYVLGE